MDITNLRNKLINSLAGKISEKVSEKIVGEDNRNVTNALIELTIKVKANFINNANSLSVCFPVPIEDNEHRISEYKILGCEGESRKCKIEDELAILNFGKKYNKGDKESCSTGCKGM
ncbi:hypothetical protein MSIBF_A2770002 [groundwater metagenome]|uniref:Uncharacterized protein n=1 Tax=groundwater metagenome TaxID=717931 RepID=A0A098EBB8_9ZZZZ